MPTQAKATGDSSLPAAQQKKGSSVTDKISGAVKVIHGAGDVVRGHALGVGDSGGNGKAIIATGRDEVQRGLDKIEGKPTTSTAAGGATDRGRGGVSNGTGAAPSLDPNAPQASTGSTAAPHANPTEKVRGDAADTRHPGERGTDNGHHHEQPTATSTASHRDAPDRDRGRVGNGTGTAPSLDSNTPQASTAAPHANPTTEKVRRDSPDTRHPVEKGTASAAANDNSHFEQPTAASHTSDRDRGGVGNGSLDPNTPQASTAAPHANPTTEKVRGDRPAAADDPSVQRDTDLRQQGNKPASSDRDKAIRTTSDASESSPANTTGQEPLRGTALQA